VSYFFNVLVTFDCFLSAVCGGQPGETLSGRAGSALLQGALRGKVFAPIIDTFAHLVGLYPTWRGHCIASIAGDKRRAQAVLNQRV